MDLSPRKAWLLCLVSIASFHAAFSIPGAGGLILLYLLGLLLLARVSNEKQAFGFGLVVGYGTFAPQLLFFFFVVGPLAPVLWFVLAFWTAFFVTVAHLCLKRWGSRGMLLAPLAWTGIEYFRSELYPLKFTWLGAAQALPDSLSRSVLLPAFGAYGAGFLMVLGLALLLWMPRRAAGVGLLAALAALGLLLPAPNRKSGAPPRPRLAAVCNLPIAGIQAEFPDEDQVPRLLDKLILQHPEAQLLVMSEYTFEGPVPAAVRDWCRRKGKYLIVGGKDPVGDSQFRNTAFVLGPDGEICFRQAKSVPIQFFKDGLPAEHQALWNSPWGKLGICVCYDLSYRRVTDELVRQGAEAIIVPTMDMALWGEQEHRQAARLAPVRAAEYGIPIFRLCSSGISQAVDAAGRTLASAPFPGDRATLAVQLPLRGAGTRPLDRLLAPLCVLVTAVLAVALSVKPRKG
ncbi:MAG TPA: nitrilase-related carbon-nitrogen hydrolase [Armatimonadota bacterium]|jgi:apolipoprotein N-acyltransferase